MSNEPKKPRGLSVADLERNVAEQIAEMMEQDGIEWVRRWQTPRPACNGVTGHVYSGTNVFTTAIWLMASGESDPRFIPRSHLFHCAEPVGKVRKGERGIPIVFYGTGKADDENGEEKRYRFGKVFYVWHVSQLDDLDESRLVPAANGPAPSSEAEREAQLDAWIANTGAKIKEGSTAAFYAPATDEIHMPALEVFYAVKGITATEFWYGTCLHELVHWTGAQHRLDRAIKSGKCSEAYAFEELVAEIGAVMAGMRLGVQAAPREDNAAYVQGWMKAIKDRPRVLFEAASLSSAAVQYLEDLQPHAQEKAA